MKNITIAVSALAIASSAASAGVVDMIYTGIGAGLSVQVHEGANPPRDLFAGELYHTISNGVGVDAYLNGAQTTFCADLLEAVVFGSNQFTVTDIENMPLTSGGAVPMGAVKADAIRSLYSASVLTLQAGGLSNSYAAAFQLAIWEIVADYDGTDASLDITAGDTIFTKQDGSALQASVFTEFSGIKADLMTAMGGGGSSFAGLIGLANEGAQDQFVVPAPGALALISLGGLVATRRRRS
tara:strand:+ start:2833 stop:3552 length:720 start_codon:yes stop_codon:yes gene_type:complete